MTRVHIDVPDDLLDSIDRRWRERGFVSRSEYFRALAREDLQRAEA